MTWDREYRKEVLKITRVYGKNEENVEYKLLTPGIGQFLKMACQSLSSWEEIRIQHGILEHLSSKGTLWRVGIENDTTVAYIGHRGDYRKNYQSLGSYIENPPSKQIFFRDDQLRRKSILHYEDVSVLCHSDLREKDLECLQDLIEERPQAADSLRKCYDVLRKAERDYEAIMRARYPGE